MKILILFLSMVVMLFFGCESNNEIIKRIMYIKDERTGICFAGHTHGGTGTIYIRDLTYVPCTEEVEKFLINKKGDDTCH